MHSHVEQVVVQNLEIVDFVIAAINFSNATWWTTSQEIAGTFSNAWSGFKQYLLLK